MSFESDGQGPAKDGRPDEQLGSRPADGRIPSADIVDVGSESETSDRDDEQSSSQHSARASSIGEDESGGDESSEGTNPDDTNSESASVSGESASGGSGAEDPPSPDAGGPEELSSNSLDDHPDYVASFEGTAQHSMEAGAAELYGLAAHAIAVQNNLGSSAFEPLHHQGIEDQFNFATSGAAAISDAGISDAAPAPESQHEHQTLQADLELEESDDGESETSEPETEEPKVEEPDHGDQGLTIEEIKDTTPAPPAPRAPAAAAAPNLDEVREQVRSETRSKISYLEEEVHRLQGLEWELRKQLNQAALQAESARAERERTVVSAAVHETELQQLRRSTQKLRVEQEARAVELRASLGEQRVELEAQRRAHDVLRERFKEQSGELAESRAAAAELERARIELEAQTDSARRAEQRTQLQLSQLREELDTTLSELANVRAELALQTQTISEVRAQARAESLSELQAPGSDEESIWRERYVELRRQMDAVASEFERREPEILALQQEHAEAEARAAQARDEALGATSAKLALERKLKAADRRASDLLTEQQLTEQLVNDLRRQVLHLLTEKMLDTPGESPLSPEDEEELVRLRDQVSKNTPAQNGEMDGQALISERLLVFRDVAELQFQNEALLKACRGLAQQLDPDGDAVASAAEATSYRNSADELREAGDALEALEQKFLAARSELEAERQQVAHTQTELSNKTAALSTVRSQLASAEQQVADLRRRLAVSAPATTDQTAHDLALLRSELQTERARLGDTQRQLDMARDEILALNKRAAESQIALSRAQQKISATESAASDARAESESAQIALSALRSEKKLWEEREQRLLAQINTLHTEAEANARTSGISQMRQAELESKLIGTMERLESLVASSANDAQLLELQEQVQAREAQIADLQTQIAGVEDEAGRRVSDHNALQSKLSEVESELEAIKHHSSDLTAELASTKARYEAEQAKFQKRDDDLVEQVNNLEDNLTEAREKLRKSQEAGEADQQMIAELSQELSTASQALSEAKTKLDTSLSELESSRKAYADLEASSQGGAVVPQEASPEVTAEREAALRAEIEAKLREDLKNSVDPETEARIKADLEKSIRSDLETTLRPELEKAIRAEIGEAPTSGGESASNDELRASIEADVRAQFTAKALSENALSSGVESLFNDLATKAPSDELLRFQQAILTAEQDRVKIAFRKRLEDVRQAAEAESQAKVTEAEKSAEEKVFKRFEMRAKLQTQKLSKLESKNKELETQVDELRNKVRRLKGGAVDADSSLSTSQDYLPSNFDSSSSHSVGQMMSSQGSQFPSAFGQFQPGSAFNVFSDQPPSKRLNFFPNIDNQKRRKDENGSEQQPAAGDES